MHVGEDTSLTDSLYLIFFGLLMIGTIILFVYGFKKMDDSGDDEEEATPASAPPHRPQDSQAQD
ncbi:MULTISPECIES: hypothetical protein [Paenibacillus]|uniref:hypothetical protein n=1 Tax=Paenibacillus TaxID=44249 RepID=UPI00038FD34A|nr:MULTISPECIES: hypothetical protein [Paenibacillus]KKC46605.1 hypothetical protein VE23_04855 [Paenibacillus sp. D9]CDN41378.1 hypothetical protein BN871_AF_00340 [Paenibacillus sp. P22]